MIQSLIRTRGADCNFMYSIFKDRKLGLQERGKTKISAFGGTEMYPKPAQILRLMIKQHSPSATRERICSSSHPLAPQLLDPFGYKQQGRHWSHTLNSQKTNSQELMDYDEQAYPTKKHMADSRAAGSAQQLQLGMSGKEGNQEPTSASEHSQDVAIFSGSAQQSQKRQQGAELPFCHLIARGVQASQALHRAWGHGV